MTIGRDYNCFGQSGLSNKGRFMKNSIEGEKNCLKLAIKKLLCITRGIIPAKENVYISPFSEIKGVKKISLGKGVVLEKYSRLYANGENASIEIGDYTTIYPYVLLKANGGKIKIGNCCSINDYAVMYGLGGVSIGDDVHISAHTVIIASEHNYENLGTPLFSKEMKGKGITIEKSVWIGANAVILDGVTIGTGSVIGAGAVVTENIPAYSIAVGVPAQVIKKRCLKNEDTVGGPPG